MNTFLITGSNGFIGFHLIKALSASYQNSVIIGVDNMNDYYDVNLKNYRLSHLENIPNFLFIKDKFLFTKFPSIPTKNLLWD